MSAATLAIESATLCCDERWHRGNGGCYFSDEAERESRERGKIRLHERREDRRISAPNSCNVHLIGAHIL